MGSVCSASCGVSKEQLCRKIRLWPVVIPFFAFPILKLLMLAQAVCPEHTCNPGKKCQVIRAVPCLLFPQHASAQHLEWLKIVKESHGSVELSSLSLAAAINSRGIYVLRAPADGQKVRLLGFPTPPADSTAGMLITVRNVL